MSYAQYLKELLRPLGVYDLEAPFSGGELDTEGQALDGAEGTLEEVGREVDLTSARDWGLERLAGLFARRPAAGSPEELGQALAALLRIGGDSFTPEAINDTISGCGIPARVEETGVGTVQVRFPGTAGVPQDFEQLKKNVEDILPAHLAIEYWFWYLTWAELEKTFSCWADIEALNLTWEQLETYVS